MKLNILVLFLVLFSFFSGCTQQGGNVSLPSLPVCGNGVVELGEECDNNPCSDEKICNSSCRCVQLTPPKLPEE